ncbi:hypothetical protein [Actinoplanes sp. NPDC051851]|uniref:hypothetical protein n=1 Tax=Actinoplanes sp. NPDC051851 TaxID=3154753 RepID=UPI0034423C76
MVRQAIKRVVSAAGVLVVAAALTLGAAPGAAQAAPASKSKPTALQISGEDVPDEGIVVQQAEDPKLFRMLLSEVSWLASAKPQTSAPSKSKLGPKYTVKVLVKDAANQVYDLYPSASGGPRAYRPASQPSGKKTAGWFYGRLSMSEALRMAGAPLVAKADIANGGIGGGSGEDLSASEVDPVESATEVFTEVRRLFLLNGAVLVVILAGLAGMAFLIRRRV